MLRTRVKICGITRPEDIDAACGNGVDAIGLVFHERSPRNVSIEQAAALSDALPAFVTPVALFMDADADTVEAVLSRVGIGLLQFHGSETPGFCRSFDRPYIKALGMLGDMDVEEAAASYQDARGILLDAHAPGADGGTGDTFDWNAIPSGLSDRLILAGGLAPDNVFDAITTTRPWAVDVSSGVERAKGVKSARLIQHFMNEVQRADG